jgi:glyoxylase-like metal-dependent hydrolase (beta-lactamase superfamily II)
MSRNSSIRRLSQAALSRSEFIRLTAGALLLPLLGLRFPAAAAGPNPQSAQNSGAHEIKAPAAMKNADLRWDVFVTPGIPIVSSDLPPPGEKQRNWSPTSSTLIYGQRDAVLVDALITVDQARSLVDWVVAHERNLTTIYATHGHGDHFFGAGMVLDRFPKARFVATHDVVKLMRQQGSPQALASFWNRRFPGQIPEHVVIADELPGTVLDLEGHDLVVVPLGHTDTDDKTCLHVPSVGLVVAGDAAYNGVHLHLGESNPQTRREWIAALDAIEALKPRAVIAGHKRPDNDDNPRIIEETRQYIRDFDRIAETTSTAMDLYQQMLALYPDRMNVTALWNSARVVKAR